MGADCPPFLGGLLPRSSQVDGPSHPIAREEIHQDRSIIQSFSVDCPLLVRPVEAKLPESGLDCARIEIYVEDLRQRTHTHARTRKCEGEGEGRWSDMMCWGAKSQNTSYSAPAVVTLGVVAT